MADKTFTVKDGTLTLEPSDLRGGLWIRVKGFQPEKDLGSGCHVFLADRGEGGGGLTISVWDPTAHKNAFHLRNITIYHRKDYKKVMDAAPEELPLLLDIKDPDARELLTRRLKDTSTMMSLGDKLFKLRLLQSYMNRICSNEKLDWAGKYELIFSDGISKKVHDLTELAYYDRDMGYEDDVRAFVLAFNDKMEALSSL